MIRNGLLYTSIGAVHTSNFTWSSDNTSSRTPTLGIEPLLRHPTRISLNQSDGQRYQKGTPRFSLAVQDLRTVFGPQPLIRCGILHLVLPQIYRIHLCQHLLTVPMHYLYATRKLVMRLRLTSLTVAQQG